jgi:Tol biopolymer transport system component
VYTLGTNLMALPFDLKNPQAKTGPIAVIEGIQRPGAGQTGASQFTVSDNGTLAYAPADADSFWSDAKLVLVDRETGKTQPLPPPPAGYSFPSMSPDAKRIAVTYDDAREQYVAIYELANATGTLRRLTFGGRSSNPIWSPDSKHVFYSAERDGSNGIYRQLADGTGTPELLFKADAGHIPFPESINQSDGTLAFTLRTGTGGQLWLLPSNGDRKPVQFGQMPNGNQTQAQFSPDGHWIAYTSTELGANNPQIFIQSYPKPGIKYQVTMNGAVYPLWSPVGKQIFYYWNNELFGVDIRTEPSVSFGKPSPVGITGIVQPQFADRSFHLSPNGKQFLVVLPASAQSQVNRRHPMQINVVLNWFRELQERVPVK